MNKQQLIDNIRAKHSFLCVGLDTDLKKVPEHLLKEDDPVAHGLFKSSPALQAEALIKCQVGFVCHTIRGCGIDNGLVEGKDGSVTPFLQYEGKWVILLALTSNKGSHDFQLTEDAEGERLFEKVLRRSQQWADDKQMMYVVGATQGRLFEDIRKIVPNHFLLVPGVGAQGGSLQEVCKYGMTKDCGLLVNSSRGIIYADNTENFAQVSAQKAHELQQQMQIELAKVGL